MAANDEQKGLSRRDFIKTIGIAGIASTGINTGPLEAQQKADALAPALPKRKLGRTGVEVSVLSLGGMFDTINNQLLLRQARNWGINFWDTAEAYGNGLSEEGYGRFFARNPDARKEIFVCTKLRAGTPQAMTEGLDKGLKRLASDYVDLFCIHGVSDFNEIGESKPFREWAAEMKNAGKIRFFGFSTHTNMEECLLASAKTDWIDVILFTYNFRLMHSPKMQEAVSACAKTGIGLAAMKTQGGGQVKTDSEAELQLAGKFLDRGFTDKQAKIKAVLENPNISSICSQMPNLTILSANVAAARDLTRLGQSDFELLEQFAAETREGYCAGCGRICGEALGGVVPVSDVMRCLMYYRDYGDHDLAREVYAGLSP